MATNEPDATVPADQLRVMQIIALALPTGLIAFLCFVLVTSAEGKPQPGEQLPLVSIVAGAMLVGALPLSIIIPGILTKSALQQIVDGKFKVPEGADPQKYASTPAKLLAVRQTTMIIGMALLEGAGFMGTAAYMIEHQLAVVGVVGVVILSLLARFPTQARVSAWIEQQAAILIDMQRAKDLGAPR